jgi:hypothetical protein
MLLPSAAVKQKAKEDLMGLGGSVNVRFPCHKQKPIENLCKSIITNSLKYLLKAVNTPYNTFLISRKSFKNLY